MHFTVSKFVIIPTGIYNPPVMRNYSVDSRNRDNLGNMTAAITNGGSDMTHTTMTKLASNILVPSSSQGEVYIPNSFSERRFRFMLELQHEDGCIQYLAGYTDRLEETRGYLPPDLKLHFNLSFTVRRSIQRMQTQARTVDSVTDISQILSAPNLTGRNALGGIQDSTDSAVTIRPSDIFTVAETKITADALSGMAQAQGDSNYGLSISRVTSCDSEFRTGIRKSKTSNTSAGRYLSDTVGAYVAATAVPNEDAFFTPFQEAHRQLGEPDTANDPFFNQFTRIGKRLSDGGCVDWSELEMLSPNITKMAMDSINLSRKSQTASGINSAFLGANTSEAIATTKLINGLTAIMSSALITKVTLFGRSGIPIGMGGPIGGNNTASTQNAFVDVLSFQSFKPDASPHVGRSVANSVLHEILADLSQGFSRDVTFNVTFDLIGDTTVSISLDGNPAMEYVNPDWCSALSSPVLASSQHVLQELSSDFSSIFKAVGSAY